MYIHSALQDYVYIAFQYFEFSQYASAEKKNYLNRNTIRTTPVNMDRGMSAVAYA